MQITPDAEQFSPFPSTDEASDELSSFRQGASERTQLLLRELTHRCANDLQMVSSLLRLQCRQAGNEEARQALQEAADRVTVLANARYRARTQKPSLAAALRQNCAALNSQAQPRSILLTLEFATVADQLPEDHVSILGLCVNELATNAIKHAFKDGKAGQVAVAVYGSEDEELIITVADDGAPFELKKNDERQGMGLDLVRRLISSIGGTLQEPEDGKKLFKIVAAYGSSSQTTRAVPLRW